MAKPNEDTASAYMVELHGNDSDYVSDFKTQLDKQNADGRSGVKISSDSSYKTFKERANDCWNQLSSDQDLVELRSKVALGNVKGQTFEMKADNAVPTEAERQKIGLWASKRTRCEKMLREHLAYFPQDANVPIINSTMRSFEALVLNLYRGEISYGQFSTYRQEMADKSDEAMRKVAEISREKNQAAQERARMIALEEEKASAARSSAISEAIRAQAAAQAAARPAPTPVMQAPLISPPVRCTSTRFGNSVDTTCQ
jgi:hypothetical protein